MITASGSKNELPLVLEITFAIATALSSTVPLDGAFTRAADDSGQFVCAVASQQLALLLDLDEQAESAVQVGRDGCDVLERDFDFAGDAYDDHDLVLCDPLGGPLRPNQLTDWFAKHCKAAGIPTGTLHTLRHTAATLMLTSGSRSTSQPPGSDHPKTVLSTYAHLLPQSDELAAERVAAALET